MMVAICVCILVQPIVAIVAGHIYNRYFNTDHLQYRLAMEEMQNAKDNYERQITSLTLRPRTEVTN